MTSERVCWFAVAAAAIPATQGIHVVGPKGHSSGRWEGKKPYNEELHFHLFRIKWMFLMLLHWWVVERLVGICLHVRQNSEKISWLCQRRKDP